MDQQFGVSPNWRFEAIRYNPVIKGIEIYKATIPLVRQEPHPPDYSTS
jgi:hypothetical protein